MSAPKGNTNALGNSGGKSLNDKQKRARVRNKLLDEVLNLLETPERELSSDKYEFKKQIMLRMCGNLLPRLNEHTGEEGGEILLKIVNYGNNPAASIHTEGISASTS